ncbi:MAG: 4-hydroxybenzoate octaprenyltransferase [Alphaproteobacteria bacterium]|nr:4-hydroxybenzoate octaprenyltransferase [Alphaproteobacteria bacterium]
MTEPRPQDAVPNRFVDTAPPAWRPYLRLARYDRPIGFWLLFWPCAAGAGLAFAAHMNIAGLIAHLLLFGIGAIAMRGAGCTYNDIIDRDIDAKVARTRGRPIPSGEVSVLQALVFLVGQSFVGLFVLLQFNSLAIWLGLASLILVASYPFMKRITYWPQAWLGLTFNWGVLVAYAAGTVEITYPALFLYAGCFFWTIGYDTIYAHQDKEDDALIGVKSSALLLGPQTQTWLFIFYGLATLGVLIAGQMTGGGIGHVILTLLFGAHLLRQAILFDHDLPLTALRLFRSNAQAGALLALACLLGPMLP